MGYAITDECIVCGICIEECPAGAIEDRGEKYYIDPDKCTECGSCIEVCPSNAIVEIE
ncbi:TPA: 4Fe-4S ferredoxin [bacterium]|nr:4Fe-4S ferredoxin [bacterium]